MNNSDFTAFSLPRIGKDFKCVKDFYYHDSQSRKTGDILFNIGDTVRFHGFISSVDEQTVIIKTCSGSEDFFGIDDYITHFQR